MEAYGLDKRDIAAVAVKNKRNAADHPAALLGQADITVEDVLASEVARLAGAAARRLADQRRRGRARDGERGRRRDSSPTGRCGSRASAGTSTSTYWTNRDLAYPEYVENAARMAYDMAGVTEPRKQIHVAEPYDPFDYKELHHLEGLQLFDKGKAPEAAAAGVTARDGDLPCCPSGGLLGVGNPIAAAGLMKIAELFWQLRGEAGARQVPGTPERGVAQAWGDLMQVGTVVVHGHRAAGRRRPPRRARARRRSRRGRRRCPTRSSARATGAVDDAPRRDVRVGRRRGDGRLPRRRCATGGIVATICAQCGRTLVPAAEVLRTLLPAHRRVDRGPRHRHRGDVLDLPRPVGHGGRWTRRRSPP